MSKVFITGAGGFLGFSLAKELRKQFGESYEIINISRNHYQTLDELNISTIKCDFSVSEQVNAIDFSGVDAIFHVAAIAGVWGRHEDFYRVNFVGTKNLVDAAKKSGVKRFIYTSSPSVVFGKEDILMGREDLPYPESYYTSYAQTKAQAEQYLMSQIEEDFLAISLRPHLIWGPNDPHLIPRIIQKAKTGRLKRVGSGENLVDVIFVDNAAKAHVEAYKALKENRNLSGNSYFIGQERPVNLWSFIDQILAKKSMTPLTGSVSFNVAFYLGYILELIYRVCGIYKPEPPMTRFVALQLAKSHYFSHEKAHRDFGYHPEITIEQGLDITFSAEGV